MIEPMWHKYGTKYKQSFANDYVHFKVLNSQKFLFDYNQLRKNQCGNKKVKLNN